MKICWITNIPSPYKIELFNCLGNYFSLTCVFLSDSEPGRDEKWYSDDFKNFNVIRLERNWIAQCRKLSRDHDILVNSNYTSPVCMFLNRMFRKQGKKTIIQADGGLAIPRGIIDTAIRFVMKKSDFFLSSGVETDRYFNYYGIQADKILKYHFSSLTQQDIVENRLLSLKKQELRNALKMPEKIILLSVGQQIPRKGYDILCNAARKISGIEVYIIGGKPEKLVSDLVEKYNLNNFHFIEFLSKAELKAYYAAADIFVLPTRYDIWGLVINEALSFGLPVVSTDHCVAALEFNHTGTCSLIAESDNAASLQHCLEKLICDPSICRSMSDTAFKVISDYTIEQMSIDIAENLLSIEGMKL